MTNIDLVPFIFNPVLIFMVIVVLRNKHSKFTVVKMLPKMSQKVTTCFPQ